jgi:RecA/RadA recombinase
MAEAVGGAGAANDAGVSADDGMAVIFADAEKAYHAREAETLQATLPGLREKATNLAVQQQATLDQIMVVEAEIADHIEKAGA